jgi:hypothetical protein
MSDPYDSTSTIDDDDVSLSSTFLECCVKVRNNDPSILLAPNLQTLVLTDRTLGSAGLAELAPALYRNTSIKVLDMSNNYLNDIESAEILRDILRSNKTITALDLSRNWFGRTTGFVECIAVGLGSNSTLLKIDLSCCDLGDGDVSILALRTRRSRNSCSVGIPLHLRVLACFSQRWNRTAATSRISTSGTTLLGTREQFS